MRRWTCVVTVLVSDVLVASVSRTPMPSPFASRQHKIACAARPTTEAKRIAKTVGSYASARSDVMYLCTVHS
jgi:hypothetical protein